MKVPGRFLPGLVNQYTDRFKILNGKRLWKLIPTGFSMTYRVVGRVLRQKLSFLMEERSRCNLTGRENTPTDRRSEICR